MTDVRVRHVLLAVLVTAIWGSNFVAIRVGVEEVPPLLFLAIRFVVVLGMTAAFIAFGDRPAPLELLGGLLLLGGVAVAVLRVRRAARPRTAPPPH